MKITQIKQQVKRRDRYSIYVEGKYLFSLGEAELIRSGLRANQELSREELNKLKDTAVLDKAYDRALNYVAVRMRSEYEIRDYLKRKDYDSEIIELILNRLSNVGFVDDARFAKAWVENRRLLKSTSKRRLKQELRQKRIAEDLINEVLEADDTDEREVLRELVERKKSRYPDKLKLMQYLGRQGFSYDDIKSVLEEND
jgi:regulatory protein